MSLRGATVTYGRPAVPSVIDAEDVAGVLRSRRTALNDCIAMGLRMHPGLQGKIVVRFVATAAGAVAIAALALARRRYR